MIPKLRAALTRNRTTLLIGGAGAVALLAWRNRTAKPADPAQASTSAYSGGGQLAGATGGYDSTSADIIGAVQPQIESLRDTVRDLTDLVNGTGGNTPIPVPTLFGSSQIIHSTSTRPPTWPVPPGRRPTATPPTGG